MDESEYVHVLVVNDEEQAEDEAVHFGRDNPTNKETAVDNIIDGVDDYNNIDDNNDGDDDDDYEPNDDDVEVSDDDDDDRTLVGDIDRINRALGIDTGESWLSKQNLQRDDNTTFVDSSDFDSDDDEDDDDDVERIVGNTRNARPCGFFDAYADNDLPGKCSDDNQASTSERRTQGASNNDQLSTIGDCDLSQDIREVTVNESEPTLENCLYLNRVYQEFIVSAIDDLDILLMNNNEQQKFIQESIEKLSGQGKLSHGYEVSMRKRRVPYFKSADGLLPPPNEDTKIKASNQELSPLLKFPLLWPMNDLTILEREIENNAMELAIRPIMARKEILCDEIEKLTAMKLPTDAKKVEYEEKERQLKEIESQKPSTFVCESREKNYDWMKISAIGFEGERLPRDCELFWKNFAHPSISKKKWSKEELDKLKCLLRIHGLNNWDLVAKELETDRLPVQCAEKYFSMRNIRSGPWSEEEKKELLEAVEACKIGDYIPFNTVANMIDGRTVNEVWRQWIYCLDPSIRRGKWTLEEDTCLMAGVWLFGAKDWGKIKNFVGSRTDVQCCDRWKGALDPSLKCRPFSRAEDDRLLKLFRIHGSKWAYIGKQIGRIDSQCSNRCKRLLEFKRKNDDDTARLRTNPKNNMKLYRKHLYSQVCARLREISNELGASLSFIKLRKNLKAISSGNRKLTAGEVRLGEHLKKFDYKVVAETMNKTPNPMPVTLKVVEKGIQEFFKLSLKKRHRGRPPRIWEIEDDDQIYLDAVSEFKQLIFNSSSSPCSSSTPETKRVPILPPMTITLQAFRNMLLMKNRLVSSIEGPKSKKSGEHAQTTAVVNSTNSDRTDTNASTSEISYNELLQQFTSLFSWPALLSALKPHEEPPKPVKSRKRKPGPKRVLGVVKDSDFKCFAKPTYGLSKNEKANSEPPPKRKKGRPCKNAPLPEPREGTRKSSRFKND